MDDMDAEAEEMGGKRKFFNGAFSRYGWAKLMSPGLGGHEMLGLYSEGMAKMPENPGVPQLFRDIFKNAYLPYRDPETLKSFLKIIGEFTYDHSERLGDAFEYLLSILGSQGDAGQFRTPRHIIDFMVSIVDPKKTESVLDPACGTAGFLISSYKHILETNRDSKHSRTLTPDEKGRLAKNFTGYDISPDMVRLSLVNLYLHGFADPHVYEYDTLSSDDRWNQFADVILANPPFMTPKGGIKPHKRFSIQSKRSEVLFLDYVLEHLTPNGRAAIVVPEGIDFVAQSGHTQLRRSLLKKNLLAADITLPHGVFKPYASVKTHILIIEPAVARTSSSVLFIEIENDGFTQSDTRDAISGSQLPSALEIWKSFKDAALRSTLWINKQHLVRAYSVEKSVLESTEDAHLIGRWHDLPNRVIHRPGVPLRRIGDICDIKDGRSPNMATLPGDYVMVVPAEERKTAGHFDYEGKAVCIPLVSSAGHGKADIKRIHYQEGAFALASTMCALFVKDEDEIRPRYLYIFLSAMCGELLVPLMCGATNVTMSSSQLSDVLIPIPSPKQQDEVIESHLIATKARDLIHTASVLRDSSDRSVTELAEHIISEAQELLKRAVKRTQIAEFVPSGSSQNELGPTPTMTLVAESF